MNSADRSILADLVSWVALNPPPGHFLLISSDTDFADILHRLRMNNYNVLIASADDASGSLCSAATILWHWDKLVRGDGLIGKYINYPPDGQHFSWYGHYKGILDKSFFGLEEDTGSQVGDGANAVGERGTRTIPLALINKISIILSYNPAGLSVDDLLKEIQRSNGVLDMDYFGHKRFSNLILSMPHIAEVKPHPTLEGQHIVYSAHSRSNEINLHERGHILGESGFINVDCIKNGEVSRNLPSTPTDLDEKSSLLPTHSVEECTRVKDGDHTHMTTESDVTMLESSLKEAKVIAPKKHVTETSKSNGDSCANSIFIPLQEHVSLKGGLLKRFWLTWLWAGVANNKNASISSHRTVSSSHGHHCQNSPMSLISGNSEIGISGGFGSRKFHSNLSDFLGVGPKLAETALLDINRSEGSKLKYFDSKDSDLLSDVTISSARNASKSTTLHGVIATSISGLVRRIHTWCNLSREFPEDSRSISTDTDKGLNNTISDKTTHQPPAEDLPEPHVLFSKPTFWRGIASFLHSKKGSELILNSIDRTRLIRCLQKEGPSILKKLKECHLLHFVELLISDKKWIEECSSQTNPFKPQSPSRKIWMLTHAPRQVNLSRLLRNRVTDPRLANIQNIHVKNRLIIASSINKELEREIPKNFEELKIWCHKVLNTNARIKPKDLKNNFEWDFRKELDSRAYGYSSVGDLLEACSATSSCRKIKATKAPSFSQKKIILDCKGLISEILEKDPAGILLRSFRSLFLERYGYPLDCKKLGYKDLMPILKAIPGIKIESEMILPSCALSADFCTNKRLNSQTSASCVEITHHTVSEDKGFSWDELGLPKKCEAKEDDESNAAERKLLFEEVSVSDEDSSDAEFYREIGTDVIEIPGNNQTGDKTFFQQIAESRQSGKENNEKTLVQSTDGPICCWGKFGKEHNYVFEAMGSKQTGDKTFLQPIPESCCSGNENNKKILVQSIDGPVDSPGKSGKGDKDVLEVPGNKQTGDETLLQQILESSYSCKENNEKTLAQSIDAPVDCSGSF